MQKYPQIIKSQACILKMYLQKPIVPDNVKKYKIKHATRMSILVVLKYILKNKGLFKINYLKSSKTLLILNNSLFIL